MPSPRPRAAARAWWALALAGQFVFVFAAVALSGPGRIDIVDGQTRYEVARSLREHGDSVIRDKYVWFRVHPGRNGEQYTPYRFPQSGAGVLAILLADATGEVSEPRRHFFFALISAVAAGALAVTYSVWFRGMGLRPGISLAWATAGIFCTPNWYYGTSTFDDMLGTVAVVLAVAVAFLCRNRRPLLGAALAGLLLGWAVNCKEPLGLFVLPVLAAAYRPGLPLRRFLAPAALVLLGTGLGVVGYQLYDLYKFPPGTADPNEDYLEKYGPMWTRDPLPGLIGLTLSPSAGALWYCPAFLLALVGWTVWRRQQPGFSRAVAVASVLFALFLCFLTFFKGEPCWGPRYLTPVFALWWVFVPAAAQRVGPLLIGMLLTLGGVIQLLALSVDPQRLLLAQAIPFNYYVNNPWLQLRAEASHLVQRPREIAAILGRQERAPQYAPAPYPTYATRVPPAAPFAVASVSGHGAAPMPLQPFSAVSALGLAGIGHGIHQSRDAVERYHVFASFRPWWLSQSYLTPAERPVDLARTVILLLGAASGGLFVMTIAGRASAAGSWWCSPLVPVGKPIEGRAALG
jgi:hypothetical protein